MTQQSQTRSTRRRMPAALVLSIVVPWGLGAQNSVRGIDTTTLPDGSPGAVFVGGVERITQVWLEN